MPKQMTRTELLAALERIPHVGNGVIAIQRGKDVVPVQSIERDGDFIVLKTENDADFCEKCGGTKDGLGFCTDDTCPYHDHSPSCELSQCSCSQSIREDRERRDLIEQYFLEGFDVRGGLTHKEWPNVSRVNGQKDMYEVLMPTNSLLNPTEDFVRRVVLQFDQGCTNCIKKVLLDDAEFEINWRQ